MIYIHVLYIIYNDADNFLLSKVIEETIISSKTVKDEQIPISTIKSESISPDLSDLVPRMKTESFKDNDEKVLLPIKPVTKLIESVIFEHQDDADDELEEGELREEEDDNMMID